MHHNSRIRKFRHVSVYAILVLTFLIGTVQGSSAWTPLSHEPHARQIGVPSVPMILNGLRSTPGVTNRVAGQNLHYVLDAKALSEGVIYAFTTPEQRDHFLKMRQASEMNPKSTAGPAATFWEHENRSGAWKQYSTSAFSLGAWSDVISSLETGTRSIRLWEHEAFGGSSLTIPADVIVEDLGPFGWSDVASSIQFL